MEFLGNYNFGKMYRLLVIRSEVGITENMSYIFSVQICLQLLHSISKLLPWMRNFLIPYVVRFFYDAPNQGGWMDRSMDGWIDRQTNGNKIHSIYLDWKYGSLISILVSKIVKRENCEEKLFLLISHERRKNLLYKQRVRGMNEKNEFKIRRKNRFNIPCTVNIFIFEYKINLCLVPSSFFFLHLYISLLRCIIFVFSNFFHFFLQVLKTTMTSTNFYIFMKFQL